MAFRILDLRCGGQHDYEAFKTHTEGLSRRFTYLIYIIRIRACARTYYICLREREKPFGKKIRGWRESQRDVFPDVGSGDGITAAAPLEDYKRILGCRYSPKVAILFLIVHPYLHQGKHLFGFLSIHGSSSRMASPSHGDIYNMFARMRVCVLYI